MNRAVFFDRDGTIIEEKNYIKDVNDIIIYDRVAEGLLILKNQGYLIILVSNQSGVARGYMSVESVEMINAELNKRLMLQGVCFDDMLYCPHYEAGIIKKYSINCDCRKPKKGMAWIAQRKHNLNLEQCVMVGDKNTDIEFGKSFGARLNILVKTGYGEEQQKKAEWDYVADTIYDACKIIADLPQIDF